MHVFSMRPMHKKYNAFSSQLKKPSESGTHGISLDGRLSYVNDVQCWNKIIFFFLVNFESCFKPFSFSLHF